jgi:transposase
MMKLRVIGIDLGKTVFHLIGMDEHGRIVLRKRCSRSQLLQLLANPPACLIGMEACGGSHYLGRALTALGHEVRLLPAQFVKPYVKSQKNDYRDAEAIAEAVQRPTMRFVPIKTDDQLDIQALHRVRDRLVAQRTGLVNQFRAFLLERGLIVRAGRAYLWRELPQILAQAEEILSPRMFRLLRALVEQWRALETQLDDLDREIASLAQSDAACQRLQSVPGIGPLVATAMVAAIGKGTAFRKGREFSAWLGLVPRQCSTGGQTKLLGISKRGNEYLRRLFIHGARSVGLRGNCRRHSWGTWIQGLKQRRPSNIAIVALANKLARIAWSVLHHEEVYRGDLSAIAVVS